MPPVFVPFCPSRSPPRLRPRPPISCSRPCPCLFWETAEPTVHSLSSSEHLFLFHGTLMGGSKQHTHKLAS